MSLIKAATSREPFGSGRAFAKSTYINDLGSVDTLDTAIWVLPGRVRVISQPKNLKGHRQEVWLTRRDLLTILQDMEDQADRG